MINRYGLVLGLVVAGLVWLACLGTVRETAQWHALYEDGRNFFCDYRMPRECAASVETYRPDGVDRKDACYPPIGYALAAAFPRDVRRGGVLFATCGAALFLLAVLVFAWRETGGNALRTFMWTLAAALSAPFVLAVTLANQILLAAAGVLLFLTWHDSPSRTRRLIGLLALAVASALKISPGIFCLMLVKRRDRKGLAAYFLLGAALFFLPFAWYGGLDGLGHFIGNLKLQSDYYSLRTTWGFVALDRAIRIALLGEFESMRGSTFAIARLATVLLGGLCAYRFFRTTDRALELLFLVAAISFLPGPSQPYTALYFLPAALVGTENGRPTWEALVWFVVFCVLQFPFGGGSANNALAGFAFTMLAIWRCAASAWPLLRR